MNTEGSKDTLDLYAETGFTPRQIAGQLKQFSKDCRFLSRHFSEFQEKYPNRWVAVFWELVVGTDEDLPSLLAFLKGKGAPISSLAIRFIYPVGEEPTLILHAAA